MDVNIGEISMMLLQKELTIGRLNAALQQSAEENTALRAEVERLQAEYEPERPAAAAANGDPAGSD